MKSFVQFINEDMGENNNLQKLEELVNGDNFELALILSDHANLKKEVVELILNRIVQTHFTWGFPNGIPLNTYIYYISVEKFKEITNDNLILVDVEIDYIDYKGVEINNWIKEQFIDSIKNKFTSETGIEIDIVEI